MMNDMLDVWMKITSNYVCGKGDCNQCHEIYGTRDCPSDIDLNHQPVLDFINKMTDFIRNYNDKDPLNTEISDEEFLSMFKEAIHATK